MTYVVSVPVWWMMFAWGALGWVAAGAVSLLSAREMRGLEAGVLRRRALASIILPPPPLPAEPAARDWRDSHLHTQVALPGSPNRAPTRSYTPAEVQAAHIASRKWTHHPPKG